MPEAPSGRWPGSALDGLGHTAGLLAEVGSFDRILELGPRLALWVVPSTVRAELRVVRPGRARTSTACADVRRRPHPVSTPATTGALSLPIDLDDLDDVTSSGGLTLYPEHPRGFDRAAGSTARVLTSQIRAALDRADA